MLLLCTSAWATTGTDVIDQTGASSNTEIAKTAVTLPGNYDAGQGGGNIKDYPSTNKGIKLRTQNKTVIVDETTYGYVILTVNSGYKLTSFKMEGTSNGSNSLNLLGVYVDVNTESLETDLASATNKLASTVTFPKNSVTYVSTGKITINATSNILLKFPSTGDNQLRVIITMEWEELPTTPTLTGAWKIGEDVVTSANLVQGSAAPTVPTFTVGATSGTPEAGDYAVSYALKDGSDEGIFTITPPAAPTAISTATAGSATIVATLTTTDDEEFLTPATNTFEYTVIISAASTPTISISGDGSVARGEELTLTANVTGVPAPDINWYASTSEGEKTGESLGTASTYVVPSTTVGTYYFVAIANNGVGGDANHDVVSSPKTITVVPQAPTFGTAAGAIFAGSGVTLSSSDDGTIYYTTNGSDPTSSSSVYSSAIEINEAMTIKAIAVKSGLTSTIASASYTIKPVATPTFSKAGLVTSGTSVTISSTDGGSATIYYTTDGSDPKSSATKATYSSALSITTACIVRAVAKVNSTFSSIASVTYTIGAVTENSIYTFSKATSTNPSGTSFTVPLSSTSGKNDNNTSVTMVYYSGGSWSAINDDYYQGSSNPSSITDGIPAAGAYIKLTPSKAGTVIVNAYSGGSKTYYVYDSDKNQKTTGSTSASGTYYDITFDVVASKDYYVYLSGSKIMFHSLTFRTPYTSVTGIIPTGNWTTFSCSCPLNLSTIIGGTAYYASDAAESTVTLSTTTATVPAGEGLMVKGTAGETFTINVAASGTAIDGNLLKGQTTTGNVAASTSGKYHYVFGYNTSDATEYGFYNLAAATSVPAGKAYLETEDALTSQGNAPAIIRILDEENNATSIESIDGKNDAIKFIENGQLYILREGVVYDALGRKVR